MGQKYRVGLLGAGYIVDSHAKALRVLDNVEIVSICDRALDKAQACAKKYGIAHVTPNLDEMLALKPDVVHVLVPPELHTSIAKQVLNAGVSVFLEKPMGLSSKDCQEIVDLAKEKHLKVGVNHNFLFLPAYEKLRADMHNGTLGKLDQVTINWLYALNLIQFGPFNNWMLREPQNLWFELGPHLLAFMMDMVGPLDKVSPSASRRIDLPGGGRVYRKWHIHGEKGLTTIDLNLSVVPGFTDRSISVRAHAATAKCDFDRNIYVRDEPSGNGILFDNFATNWSLAKQLAKNSTSNLFSSIKHTIKSSPRANPFGESIERSIAAFYSTFAGTLDSRIDGQFGVNVIKACEEIVTNAGLEPAKKSKTAWVVAPPIKKPNVLVIGGTGFIGKYLVKKLTELGHGVRVVTRGMSAGNIGLAGLPVELVQGELTDEAFLDQALDGIDVVYHLAKSAGNKWQDYVENDINVTKKIAERALAAKVKQFIYTGTIASYLAGNKNDVITGDTPVVINKTRNNYARSKATCEQVLMQMHREQDLPVSIFRPAVVIGKGCPPAHLGVGLFNSESRVQYWGDGTNKLPLVLVEDVADALALALGNQNTTGQAFLLTDEPMLSAREYVAIVSEASGTKMREETTSTLSLYLNDCLKEGIKNLIRHPNRRIPGYRDWDSTSLRAHFDNTKAKQVLGWQPAGNKEALIERGIVTAVHEFMR